MPFNHEVDNMRCTYCIYLGNFMFVWQVGLGNSYVALFTHDTYTFFAHTLRYWALCPGLY